MTKTESFRNPMIKGSIKNTPNKAEPKPKVPLEINNYTTLVMTPLATNPTQYTLDFTLVMCR
jgi:hypothetical protein